MATKTEIKKGNKAIALFMNTFEKYESDRKVLIRDIQYKHVVESMQYHYDWLWLMPVVQKIDEIGFDVHISRISCKITRILEPENVISSRVCGDISKKIEVIWAAVVAFIEWYNKQK